MRMVNVTDGPCPPNRISRWLHDGSGRELLQGVQGELEGFDHNFAWRVAFAIPPIGVLTLFFSDETRRVVEQFAAVLKERIWRRGWAHGIASLDEKGVERGKLDLHAFVLVIEIRCGPP